MINSNVATNSVATNSVATNSVATNSVGVRKNTSFQKNGSKKNFTGKKKQTKPVDERPPFAILSMELTGKKQHEKIIRVSEMILHSDGEIEKNVFLFSNGDTPISESGTKHHKITEKDLIDKPDISTYNFKKAQNLIFWDARVAFNIFRQSGITDFSPMINLHSLARHISEKNGSISLAQFASSCDEKQKNIILFKLQKAENKVDALKLIFDSLKKRYSEKYEAKHLSATFLFKISKCSSRKDFDVVIGKEARKIRAWSQQIENKINKEKAKQEKSTQKTPHGKKVIVVNKNNSGLNGNNGKKVIVVNKNNSGLNSNNGKKVIVVRQKI